MEWLVTGGAGYIGSHVVKQLQQNGFKVIVLDDLSTGKVNRLNSETIFYKGSILDKGLLSKIFQTQKIEGIIHLAGKKSVAESTINPSLFFEINSLGSEILIDVALSYGIKNIIFSSTAAVYGQEGIENKFTIRSKTFPVNPYGQSKLLAEKLLKAHLSDKDLNLVFLRYFNVTGFYEIGMFDSESENLFALIRKSINVNVSLTVNGLDYPTPDGSCIRDYIHVEDVARVHIKCINLILRNQFRGLEILNIGSGVGYSVLEVISEVELRSGKKIPWTAGVRRPGDAPHVICDIQETVQKLGWEPEISPFRDF